MSTKDFTPQVSNDKTGPDGHDPLNFYQTLLRTAPERKLGQMIAYLELELDRSRRMLAQIRGETSASNAALLVVDNATGDSENRQADYSDEVRQFGLTVAYAVIEAILSEAEYLPQQFTADDLVLASDVLIGEMSREWSR